MCKKTKGLHNRIDICMKSFIESISLLLPSNVKIISCCCGHFKYPMTIILKYDEKDYKRTWDMVSGIDITRNRKFYKKDKQGYYYIPEVINDKI